MIRKLRRRFVAISMSLLFVVLLLAGGSLLYTTYRQQRSDTLTALRMALENGGGSQKVPIGKPQSEDGGRASPRFGSAVFVVTVDSTGAITDSKIENVEISDETLAAVTAAALDSGDSAGTIASPALRWQKKTTADGAVLAFADRSSESAAVSSLLLKLAAVLCGALAAFFGICELLARLALRPVEAAWEQQRQFVADASHELKTPLTVILANASIMARHSAETVASQNQWLDGIAQEGGRMKKLIDDLLFLAKSDAARAPVVLSRVDFSDAVWSSALSFESVAFERGIALETQIEPGLAVRGDEARLKRLADTLVDNACKYAGGEKRVVVALSGAAGEAVLAVTNTGTEIPPGDLPHIFERFYRADESRTQGTGGYGLGLSIAAAIAAEHRGAIRAESAGGKTTFTVTLPLDRAEGRRAPAQQ